MLILWLNKRVSHGGGAGAGTAPWHQGCVRAGVASRHPSSQSRTCSPAPISYAERETRRCLPVQRSSSPGREHLWQQEQNERCIWKPPFPPTHTRESNEKMKADRGLSPRVWFWFSFMRQFHQRPRGASSGHHLQAAAQGRTWRSAGPSQVGVRAAWWSCWE